MATHPHRAAITQWEGSKRGWRWEGGVPELVEDGTV